MQFTVKGKPQGKGRPRYSRLNGRMYTPQETEDYERLVGWEFKAAGGKCIPEGRYVRVYIEAFYEVPKSWSKKKKQEAMDLRIRPDKKPDADNIMKIIMDGLNGLAYDDDRQVIDAVCRKFYIDRQPYVHVTVTEAK